MGSQARKAKRAETKSMSRKERNAAHEEERQRRRDIAKGDLLVCGCGVSIRVKDLGWKDWAPAGTSGVCPTCNAGRPAPYVTFRQVAQAFHRMIDSGELTLDDLSDEDREEYLRGRLED